MDTVPTSESTFKSPDGHEFYTKTWSPPSGQTLKARLVFLHGFSDHCNFYETLFDPLAEQGIKVYSFDQRGWGRSVRNPSQKGLTGPTSQVMDDVTSFFKSLFPTFERDDGGANVPIFLGGHSMGGAECLTYAATGPAEITSRIRGYICESPYIALHPSSAPFRIIEFLGRLVAKIAPSMHMPQQLDPAKVTRDAATVQRYKKDDLCHDTGTFAGLAGMLDRAADLDTAKVVLREGRGEGGATRLWIGHGTEDQICDFAACKRMFERLGVSDKELRAYPGWYHKLHTEPGEDRVLFAKDVAKWILDRSGPADGLTAAKAKL